MNALDDRYILNRNSAEYQRLRSQSQLWEDVTRQLLQQAGVRPGLRCLDVGCGPGEVMRMLGELVGPGGSVTGMDVDGPLGRKTAQQLGADGGAEFHFHEANVEQAEDVPGAPFDVTYARLLLFHVGDPVAVLRKLWRWTRPGGVLVVQDYDLATWESWPPLPAVAEIRRVFTAVAESAGRDIRTGFKLPWLLGQAGIGAPDGMDMAGRQVTLAEAVWQNKAVYDGVFPRAQQLGLADPAERQRLFDELDSAAQAGGCYTFTMPLMFGAWKRRAA